MQQLVTVLIRFFLDFSSAHRAMQTSRAPLPLLVLPEHELWPAPPLLTRRRSRLSSAKNMFLTKQALLTLTLCFIATDR